MWRLHPRMVAFAQHTQLSRWLSDTGSAGGGRLSASKPACFRCSSIQAQRSRMTRPLRQPPSWRQTADPGTRSRRVPAPVTCTAVCRELYPVLERHAQFVGLWKDQDGGAHGRLYHIRWAGQGGLDVMQLIAPASADICDDTIRSKYAGYITTPAAAPVGRSAGGEEGVRQGGVGGAASPGGPTRQDLHRPGCAAAADPSAWAIRERAVS